MDLEGKYEWVNSKRTGKPNISFVLHSTRWLRDEHFDVRTRLLLRLAFGII